MDLKKARANPVTLQQKEFLTEFISKRQEMISGKFTPNFTREKMKANWMEVTNILNSVPGGPAKDWQQWRKTWVDLKKNTKARINANKKYATGTGGGGFKDERLEGTMEGKILDIISPVACSGDPSILESNVNFDQAMVNIDQENQHIEEWEHDYVENEKLPIPKAPETEEKVSIKKRKRMTKVSSLNESLKNNSRLLTISEEKMEIEKRYYEKKIEILQKAQLDKKEYQEKKIKCWENTLLVVQQIVEEKGHLHKNAY